ncbi:MAG: hypothetical protein HOI65_14605 [Opitutae bacterium]|nr:hypothetical protein [Opitutae bacterium]
MKNLIHCLILSILATVLPMQGANLKPGLVGEYFKSRHSNIPKGAKPFLVRIDKQVKFHEVSGDFYGSKLSQNLTVRWTGQLMVEKSGDYKFASASDDGSRILIDGKIVVNNWGDHSWTRKEGKTHLTFGIHKIEIQLDQGGGGVGCIAYWTPPGGKEEPIPTKALYHKPEQAEIAWDKKGWEKARAGGSKPAPRRPTAGGGTIPANFGNFIGTAVRVGQDEHGDNIAYRAQVIRLNEDGSAGVVFDADTIRMAVGWTQPAIKFEGLPFSGGHGAFPNIRGATTFTNKALPGWAKDGVLSDPREGPYSRLGPLPREWAKYKGLYIHGDKTVLKYTVGSSTVLEYPHLNGEGEEAFIVRRFEIDNPSKPLTLVIADVPATGVEISGSIATFGESTIGVQGLRKGKIVQEGTTLCLQVPGGPETFQVAYAKASDAAATKVKEFTGLEIKLSSLKLLTSGGPARWGDPIVTKGEISKDTNKAYVIDRIPVPYNNPLEPRMRLGGFDFFSDGTTAAVCTWDGDVWIVKGIDEDLDEVTWKRFATGQHEPLGLKIVDDIIYTVADDQITRYHDLNKDGEADFYENFNNDWDLTNGFHAFCFDLHTDPKGNFYFAFGSPVRGGGRSFERMGRHHGSIIKVSKDGSRMERYATGLRAPNGMGVGPDGQVTSGDNEGTFVPRSPINWMTPGSFHGVVDAAAGYANMKTTPTVSQLSKGRPKHLDPSEAPKPLAWLPKGVDNSGGGQTWVTSKKWGGLDGELLHLSYGRSALYLVVKEFVNGQIQGGVVPFKLRFTSSCMRGRFNERDGQLYISGLKGWQTNAGKNGGLDRVRYTGKPVNMPKGLNIKKDGLILHFTSKLDKELAEDPGSYSIRSSNITWSHNYGSGDKDQKTYKVESARLLGDGKSVQLKVPTIGPAHQMEISIDVETEDGDEIITKIWNTVHEQS